MSTNISATNILQTVFTVVPVIILVILVAYCIFSCIRIVPQEHVAIIERLGKYRATWQAGLHFKVPFIDKIARTVSLKEQVCDFPPQSVITSDNVTMSIDSVVFIKIFDPQKCVYGIENALKALENLTATTLRAVVGNMILDETLSKRDEINAKMQTALDDATDPWGIKVFRVEVKNIKPPAEIEEVMTKQMRAERERRETVLQAQAHKESVVTRAEGDKQAKVLAAQAERDAQIAIAEGKAQSVRLVYEAEAAGLEMLKEAHVSDTVLKLKGIDALKTVADGRATKIFMPNDLAGAVSSLGLISESLGIGDHTPIDKSPKPEPKPEYDPCIDENSTEETLRAKATSDQISKQLRETRGALE